MKNFFICVSPVSSINNLILPDIILGQRAGSDNVSTLNDLELVQVSSSVIDEESVATTDIDVGVTDCEEIREWISEIESVVVVEVDKKVISLYFGATEESDNSWSSDIDSRVKEESTSLGA